MKTSNIRVEVNTPIHDTYIAMIIIDRFLKANKIKIDLVISYDYDMSDMGLFPFLKKETINPVTLNPVYRVFINPHLCKTQNDCTKNITGEPYCPGYTSDLSIFGVTVHEFTHVLQYKTHKGILKDFVKTFPTERFYLNDYCNNQIHDESAEILTLFITNPYLLKLISESHWRFCKKYFKSATPCTSKKSAHIYRGFPIHVKDDLRSKWRIVYDESENKFVKLY